MPLPSSKETLEVWVYVELLQASIAELAHSGLSEQALMQLVKEAWEKRKEYQPDQLLAAMLMLMRQLGLSAGSPE